MVIVIWCAMLAAKKGPQIREFKKGMLPFILVLGLVSLLILLQPNLSMATLVALLGGLVLFASGAKIGHFILLSGVGVILVFHQIRDAQYRLARLLTFLNPGDATTEAGFQIHQSLIGIGSGGIFGTGFGEGQQKLGYLPYAYSDFLFSTIGEEWGFLGVLVVVSLFALFCWLGFRIARTAADPFGQYLAVGLTAAIGLTAFMHMAVSLGPDADHGAHAAVHVVRPLQPGHLAAGHRHPHQYRQGSRQASSGASARGPRRPIPRRAGRRAGAGMSRRTILIAGGGTGGHLTPALAIASAIEATGTARAGPGRARCAASRPRSFPPANSAITCCPPSRSIAAPGGRTCAGRCSPGACCAGWTSCCRPSAPQRCSAPAGTPPRRWSGVRRDAGFRPRSRSRTPIPASPPAGSAAGCATSTWACPEARRLLRFGSRTQVFDTGNPIVPPTPERRPEARKLFGLEAGTPVVLVTGGSQGALAINRAVAGWLESGGAGERRPHLGHRPGHPRRSSPASTGRREVQVVDFLDPMADGYAVADLVVSRAGMITVAELCAWGLPSILIPLPTAAADHQTHNARVLAEAGASAMLPQSELTRRAAGAGD